MMNENLWDDAEKLASRPYDIVIEQETLTDGTLVYVLHNPELPGCKAEGISINEAKQKLDEARLDYIYALLQENLPVPSPTSEETTTTSSAQTRTWFMDGSNDLMDQKKSNQARDEHDQASTSVQISLRGDFARQH